MESLARHQCLIYQGAPSRHLPAVAAVASQKLRQHYRCVYLNSAPMLAGMRSYLAAAGVDVAHEVRKGSLVLTSDRRQLVDGAFDVERMIECLEEALLQSLADGYHGMWASGDMTWEMGSAKDYSKVAEYEWRLEELLRAHPQLCGICQYHADTLPAEAIRQGMMVHPTIFVSKTLSLLNPYFVRPESFASCGIGDAELDSAITHLCHRNQANDSASS
jgi:MEDS: MEthanogen/methylotroph, DcmR Sensory domain